VPGIQILELVGCPHTKTENPELAEFANTCIFDRIPIVGAARVLNERA
jgi:hypothetical protein